MPKYRRKPVDVEAVQFFPEQNYWPSGVTEIKPHWRTPAGAPKRYNFQDGGSGSIGINPGDWVVTNQTGERYVVRRESFGETYELVSGT